MKFGPIVNGNDELVCSECDALTHFGTRAVPLCGHSHTFEKYGGQIVITEEFPVLTPDWCPCRID